MIFEVVDIQGKPVMTTQYPLHIPHNTILSSMEKNGYKFKIDGKIIPKKKIESFVKAAKFNRENNDM